MNTRGGRVRVSICFTSCSSLASPAADAFGKPIASGQPILGPAAPRLLTSGGQCALYGRGPTPYN